MRKTSRLREFTEVTQAGGSAISAGARAAENAHLLRFGAQRRPSVY
jgi:hypothetical protein